MHRSLKVKRPAAALATALLWLMAASQAFAVDNFDPNPVDRTLPAGGSTTVDKTLHLDALPGAADIIIAVDTTGSMAGAIAQAKAQATALCTDVKAQIPGARFAVFDFRDIPDYPPTGVLIKTPVFTGECTLIQAAIDTMFASGGDDIPEAYNGVFHAAYSDPVLDASRRGNAVQFLVVLGDAPPHNSPAAATAPACGNTPPADPGGMTSDTEIAGLVAHDITLLMINYDGSGILSCYQQLADDTGGTAVNAGSDLSTVIIGQIQAAAAHIDRVQLNVTGVGCQTPAGVRLSFSPLPPYGPFTAPVDIHFTETIDAPTLPGAYQCIVEAVVDGTVRARQVVNVTVVPGAPFSLDLQPETDTNTAGQQHCMTATVRDSFGNLVGPGIVVNFTVSGANSTAGVGVTNAGGVASFCYIGTHAGTDDILAQAVGGTNPSDTAVKRWIPGPPASITLSPVTATNFVDQQHCVTATVRDAFGNVVPGATVTFTVSGSVSTTGTRTTGSDGTAAFCYTGPGLPGADVITATASGGTNPRAAAAKTWVIPLNQEGCKVTYGGWIIANNGDRANFGGNAHGKGPKGQEEYQDHGPAMDINVHSINVLAVTCSSDGTMASIFGKATIDGAGSYDYRIDVTDLGEPGRSDRYRIRLSNGYDSGDRQLRGGNVQIH